ncbi:short-chain dehydrogenase [Burkholderia gladioli]|uniref:SDR family oxidoreductase n=1 Tax=Burkholderia gladioli TaxID=28095 RepID=UPI00050E2A22|nr:SDR family oxidoreductase [Burkholderia gladioli]AYQ87409.1 SDR family oxidoreductase [Burkholderia gladioli]KGE07372.1 short-chain dehydrogenase [Burkholderia gladioli]
MSRLQGKRTLITGGTSGIGLTTAKRFLAEGARVIVTGQDPERLERARAELGSEVLALRADSAELGEQQRLAQAVADHYGQLDVAFLNAGVSVWLPIEQWTEPMFARSFDVNLKGPFFLIQALLPVFANPASVVLNTSINAHVGAARSSVYAASKAALLSLSKTLSSELLERGVRINAVSPGPVDTPLYDKLGIPDAYREQVEREILASIPAGRFGLAEEVASAVLHLASDDSAWSVGSEMVVDGGRMLNG